VKLVAHNCERADRAENELVVTRLGRAEAEAGRRTEVARLERERGRLAADVVSAKERYGELERGFDVAMEVKRGFWEELKVEKVVKAEWRRRAIGLGWNR